MSKRLKFTNRTTSRRQPARMVFLPGLRLIGGNALILAVAFGLKSLFPTLSSMPVMFLASACLLALWVNTGRSFRRQAASGRAIALSLLLAEICPAAGILIAVSLQKTDDGIPFIIGMTLSILFATWMPLVVLLSFVFMNNQQVKTKPDQNL